MPAVGAITGPAAGSLIMPGMRAVAFAVLVASCGDTAATMPDAPGVDGAPDAGTDGGPFVPTLARAELIATSPTRVLTPPAWNPHLPKLAGDGMFLYAVHTYFTDVTDTRYAAILRRPAVGGAWSEVARVVYPHQPPGVVMDSTSRMHMVFDCLRPANTDVECFPGGAGTVGNTSRFYHLVFSARDATGALRFDTYTNANEWTAESNGYHGIGTTADGVTWWSLADASYARVVQFEGGTIGTLTTASSYLLYPIHASHGSQELILYAGEFDPTGGNNASYVASTAFSGTTGGLAQLFRRAPATEVPGAINAFPSDIAFDDGGTLFALAYQPAGGGQCTQLVRFDAGLTAPPTILPVGCVSDYAKLQFSRDGTLYLLTDGSGANVELGISSDRGTSWSFVSVPLSGTSASDVQFHGFTVLKPYHSPALYDPDRLQFFFYGADAQNGVANSYFGEIQIGPATAHNRSH